MEKGFYALTSGMLTQSRKLNTISNNMGNTATPGYKKDTITSTTFRDQMIYRMGNMENKKDAPLGTASTIRVVDGTVTDYSQGSFSPTGRALDMAISGDGFFAVQTTDGVRYTRSGSFTLDNEGYLYSPDTGRVLGADGAEILLNSDKINVDASGNIYSENNQIIGRIAPVQFTDNTKLVKVREGVYKATEDAEIKPLTNVAIEQRKLEDSNVNMMTEMVDMMSSQRALQSSSQLLKMYDQLLGKVVSEIGRV